MPPATRPALDDRRGVDAVPRDFRELACCGHERCELVGVDEAAELTGGAANWRLGDDGAINADIDSDMDPIVGAGTVV